MLANEYVTWFLNEYTEEDKWIENWTIAMISKTAIIKKTFSMSFTFNVFNLSFFVNFK